MERFSLLGRINQRRKSCLSKNRKSKNYRLGIKGNQSANINTYTLSDDKESMGDESFFTNTTVDTTLNSTISNLEISNNDGMPLDYSVFPTTPESIKITSISPDLSNTSSKSKLSVKSNAYQASKTTTNCSDVCGICVCNQSHRKHVSAQCNIPPSGNSCYYCALHEACNNDNGIVQQIVQHPYFGRFLSTLHNSDQI